VRVSILNILGLAVAAMALLYVGLVGSLWLAQRPLMYPAWAIPAEAAAAPPPPGLEQVTLVTADGERLRALWRAPAPGGPLVVTFHGNAATPVPYARRFSGAAPWSTLGTGVLAMAYRGYPGSTGSPTEAGLIADADAALAFARDRAPDAPLVLHGHSLGAAVAVAAATRHPARLLYLEAPFLSATSMAQDLYPFVPSILLSDTFRSDLRLPQARADHVLVTHGGRDGVVPATQGAALAALRPDATFLSVADADHVSILGVGDDRAAALAAGR
jgi:fermentation-respiration switch protein FrsA (DUF1100 family)